MAITVPDLPSAPVRISGQRRTRVAPGTGRTVAVIGTHDWGPIGSESAIEDLGYDSMGEWEDVAGLSATVSRTGVLGAFQGGGTESERGAGRVVWYRIAAASAARATRTVQNTAGTPANALRIDALWKGTRGNRITTTKDADPAVSGNDRLRVLVDGAVVETYSYPAAALATLAAQVNARSNLVRAVVLVDGTSLAAHADVAITGGADGATVTTTEFAAAQTALEYADFSVLAVAGLTDVPTKVQIATWVANQSDADRPVRVIFGGAAGETLDAAAAELNANAALRSINVVRFGGFTWYDETLGASLSSAELAPRIAGILAARGDKSSLTRAAVAGLSIVGAGATRAQIAAARNAGVTTLRRVSDPDTTLAIAHGVTTFISKVDPLLPYEFFSDPRIVGILHGIRRRLSERFDQTVVGDLPVTQDTRDLVKVAVLGELDELVAANLADPASVYAIVEPTDDPALRNAIPYSFGFQPYPTALYVIGNGLIS